MKGKFKVDVWPTTPIGLDDDPDEVETPIVLSLPRAFAEREYESMLDDAMHMTQEEAEALFKALRKARKGDWKVTKGVYKFVDEGTVGGVQYVTVLDAGGNPQEYNLPRHEALGRYGSPQ